MADEQNFSDFFKPGRDNNVGGDVRIGTKDLKVDRQINNEHGVRGLLLNTGAQPYGVRVMETATRHLAEQRETTARTAEKVKVLLQLRDGKKLSVVLPEGKNTFKDLVRYVKNNNMLPNVDRTSFKLYDEDFGEYVDFYDDQVLTNKLKIVVE